MVTNTETRHLLGIETSGLTSGIYISINNSLLAQISLNIKNIHSRRLSGMIHFLLDQADLTLRNISAIVLSAGPGSFTGLRIGYSLAKGLAHARVLPIVEVPTLDIWAYQAGMTELPVIAIMDARREEIFCAQYSWKNKEFQRQGNYQLLSFTALTDLIKRRTLITGADLERLSSKIDERIDKNVVLPHPLPQQPEGRALLQLGYRKFLAREYSQAETCEPMYIRAFKGIM
jgi:tRNA threonylcarbamoyladenosine biosynthesis protein TsaB